VLGNGDYTYMTLTCPAGFEIVRVRCSHGVVVLDRGMDGTHKQFFPIGSCLQFSITYQTIEDMIEQHQFCPADCRKASIVSGAQAPAAALNVPYWHQFVLSGTPPFGLGTVIGPDWLNVTLDAGVVRLSGTPTAIGTSRVEIPLWSCGEYINLFTGCITVS
jgi:hypothetical protein